MITKQSLRGSENVGLLGPLLTTCLPFISEVRGGELEWTFGPAKSAQGAHAAGTLCAKAYLKYRANAYPRTELQLIAALFSSKKLGRFSDSFAFGFFCELDTFLTCAGELREVGETFESLAASIKDRIELTEAQFMREHRSGIAKEVWARKRQRIETTGGQS